MYIINFLFLSSAMHLLMDYFFKYQYQTFLYSLSYTILYNYGKLEIICKNNYNKFIKNSTVECILDKLEEYYIYLKRFDTEIISRNKIKERVKLVNILNNYKKFINCDLIIYTEEFKKSNLRSNKVILDNVPNFLICYEKCDYHFLSLSLSLKNNNDLNNLEIQLSNKNDTYFVVNNRINSLLIAYLLKIQHNISIDPLYIEYNIQIIDHNVNIFNISEKEEIILLKDKYITIPYNYLDHKNAKNNRLISIMEKNCESKMLDNFEDNFEDKFEDDSNNDFVEVIESIMINNEDYYVSSTDVLSTDVLSSDIDLSSDDSSNISSY